MRLTVGERNHFSQLFFNDSGVILPTPGLKTQTEYFCTSGQTINILLFGRIQDFFM